jgi:hypothetical protein
MRAILLGGDANSYWYIGCIRQVDVGSRDFVGGLTTLYRLRYRSSSSLPALKIGATPFLSRYRLDIDLIPHNHPVLAVYTVDERIFPTERARATYISFICRGGRDGEIPSMTQSIMVIHC